MTATVRLCCQTRPVDPQPEPVESINAVTLVTTDMAQSVAFYEALGFRLVSGGAGSAFSTFRAGDGYVNLQSATRASREVWGRVVFWVDDVDVMYHRALESGFAAATSPADATWGERYFHIRDPDGHELSFARPLVG